MIEVFCKMAREAKSKGELDDVIKATFKRGLEQGRYDRQREVRDALSQLGLTDAALFEQST